MVSSSERSRPPRAARIGSTSPIMSAMVTSGVASFSTNRLSRGIQAMGVLSPSPAIFSRQARQMGLNGSSLISQPATTGISGSSKLIKPRKNAALGLPAESEQNEIVPRQQRVHDLRNYRVFIAMNAGEERLALFQSAQQIPADFALHGARSAARIEIGDAPEFAQPAWFGLP